MKIYNIILLLGSHAQAGKNKSQKLSYEENGRVSGNLNLLHFFLVRSIEIFISGINIFYSFRGFLSPYSIVLLM